MAHAAGHNLEGGTDMTDSPIESANPPNSLDQSGYLSQRVEDQIDWYDDKSS